MKPILKFAACILLLGTMFFVSCSKSDSPSYFSYPPPPPPPPPPSDTLSGKEFLFNDLVWVIDIDSTIHVSVENRPDLFDNPDRPMEVSIRFDTSAVWVNVPRMATPLPPNDGYVYDIYGSVLYVFAIPANVQFVGLNVSIKVKFL